MGADEWREVDPSTERVMLGDRFEGGKVYRRVDRPATDLPPGSVGRLVQGEGMTLRIPPEDGES